MDATLIEQIDASGLKKKFIAKSINVTPGFLSNCIAGTKNLSRKKEEKLSQILKTALQVS